MPVIKQIGQGWVRMRAGGRVMVIIRNWIGGHSLVADMMPVEGIQSPEDGVCWCIVVYRPLYQGEVGW